MFRKVGSLLMVVVMVATGLAIMPTSQKAAAQEGSTQMCVQEWADVNYVYEYVEEYLQVEALHLTVEYLGIIPLVDSWFVTVSYWTESGEYVSEEFTIPISDNCDGFDALVNDPYSWQCQTDLTSEEIEYLVGSGYYSSLDIWYDGESWWIGPLLITVEHFEINAMTGYFELWIEGQWYTKTISCTPVWHPDAASLELATTQYIAGGQVSWTCGGNPIMDQDQLVYSGIQVRDGYNLLTVVTGQKVDPASCVAYDMDGNPISGWYADPVGESDYH